MSGVALSIELQGIERLNTGIDKLSRLGRNPDFFDAIGGEIESQTRRRLMEEKTDPDGNKWIEWSVDYARTRESKHSLLISDGELHDSITYNSSDRHAEVGSIVKYAGTQNNMRQFIGLSDDNFVELGDMIDLFISDLLGDTG